MNMYNTVTIEKPGALTLATLPDELGRDGAMWRDNSATDNRLDREAYAANPDLFPAKAGDPDGTIEIAGNSKYQVDLAEVLEELSATTGRITWTQDWSGEDPERTVTIFEAGDEVPEGRMHTELVPGNLADLIAALQAPLDVYDTQDRDVISTSGRDSKRDRPVKEYRLTEVAADMAAAARALIAALA